MRKKWLSILMAMIVSATMIPVGIFADVEDLGTTTTIENTAEVSALGETVPEPEPVVVEQLKVVTSYSTTAVKLTWNAIEGATKYVLKETTADDVESELECVEPVFYKGNLKPCTGFTYTIKAVDEEGKTIEGVDEVEVVVATAPSGKATISKLSNNFPWLKVTWKKASGSLSGYHIQCATNSKFTSNLKGTYVGNKTSANISNLIHGKKYYTRIRPYYTFKGVRFFGTYRVYNKLSPAVKTTGWSGLQYYYKNGATLKGQRIIGGNPYFLDPETGRNLGANEIMWDNVKDLPSKTKYLISIDRYANRLVIYKGKEGAWKVYKYMKCTTGKASTKTPKGTFKAGKKLNYMNGHNKNYTCWYATNVTGHIYIHSVLYYYQNSTRIKNGTLGANKSNGCIRVSKANALWIKKNIGKGTCIKIITSGV